MKYDEFTRYGYREKTLTQPRELSDSDDAEIRGFLTKEGFNKALEEGQFIVYYQPQYNQQNNTIYGAEALIRLSHPQMGMVIPSKFIPILGQNDLIGRLDKFVLEETCRNQRRWLDEGIDIVPISVNLSSKEIQSDEICYQVDETVSNAHLPKEYINIEITESAYIIDPDAVISVVKKFQELGYKVEMDGFGSGYSSLNSLKDNTVDVLKMNVKFLEGKQLNNRGSEIISSVVRMAHWLGMPVIAEGVETQVQADFLRSIGCFYVQGFFFDSPMPAEEFRNRLCNRSIDYTKDSRQTLKTKTAINYFSADGVANTLLDEILGAAAVIEFDGVRVDYIRMNDAMYDMFNITPEHNQKRLAFEDIFADGYSQIYVDAIRKAIRTEDSSECETLNYTSGDRKRLLWTRTRFKFLRGFDGVYTLFITVDNIDKYKNAMMANAQMIHELDAIENSNYFGVITVNESPLEVSFANETAAKMFGYTVAEFMSAVKENAFALVPADERDELIKDITGDLFKEPYVFSKRVPVTCKDGSTKSIQAIGSFKTMFGGIRVINLILIDTRDNRLSSESDDSSIKLLKDEASNWHNIAKTIGRKYTLYSMNESRILRASKEFSDMLGYTSDEFENVCLSPYEDLVWPSDRERMFRKICDDVVKHGRYIGLDNFRLIKRDGTPKWVSCRNHEIIAANGQKLIYVTYDDMDEVNTLSHEIEKANALNTAIGNNPFGGIIIYKIVGKRWVADYISPGYLSITGYTKNQIQLATRNDMLALVHPDDREFVRATAIANSKPGDSYKLQYRCMNANGEYDWILSYASAYSNDDATYAYQSVVKINQTKELEKKLQDENEQMETILNSMPGGIILFEMLPDDMIRIEYASDGIAKLSGRSIDEYKGIIDRDYISNIYESDEPLLRYSMRHAAKTGDELNITMRVVHSDNHLIWLSMNGHTIGEKNGNPLMLCVYRDISSETEQFLDIMEEAEFGVIVSEIHSHDVLYDNAIASKVTKELFDMSTKEICEKIIYNRNPSIVVHSSPEMGVIEYETQAKGRVFYIRYRRQRWHGRDSYICFIMDETDRSIVKEIDHLRHDATGVLTRAEAIRQIKHSLEQKEPSTYAMIMLDMDDLKYMNDTYGHPQGDAALLSIAKILQESFRDYDTVGRIGGDEFLVFADGFCDEEALISKMQNIMQRFRSIELQDVGDYRFSCSAGCIIAERGAFDFDGIYDLADRALYEAKHMGKHTFCIRNTVDND